MTKTINNIKLHNDFAELYSDLEVLKNICKDAELQNYFITVIANIKLWETKLDLVMKTNNIGIANNVKKNKKNE